MPKNPLKKQYWTEVIDGFHSPDRTDSANDRSSSPDNFELSSVNSPVRVNVSSSGNDDILKGDTKEYPRDVKATPEAASYVEDINNTNLNKDLSVRHLLTLAVGGAIGTGFVRQLWCFSYNWWACISSHRLGHCFYLSVYSYQLFG